MLAHAGVRGLVPALECTLDQVSSKLECTRRGGRRQAAALFGMAYDADAMSLTQSCLRLHSERMQRLAGLLQQGLWRSKLSEGTRAAVLETLGCILEAAPQVRGLTHSCFWVSTAYGRASP